jgi:hypothetical protein
MAALLGSRHDAMEAVMVVQYYSDFNNFWYAYLKKIKHTVYYFYTVLVNYKEYLIIELC